MPLANETRAAALWQRFFQECRAKNAKAAKKSFPFAHFAFFARPAGRQIDTAWQM